MSRSLRRGIIGRSGRFDEGHYTTKDAKIYELTSVDLFTPLTHQLVQSPKLKNGLLLMTTSLEHVEGASSSR